MKRKCNYIWVSVLVFTLLFTCSNKNNDALTARTKIALRAVGNQLLLFNKNSTSLVLPVVALETSKYQLAFQKHIFIEPSYLVKTIKQNFEKAKLSQQYRIEVVQCSDSEIAYSYEIRVEDEQTLIPCVNRILPLNCYIIEVNFITVVSPNYNAVLFWLVVSLIILVAFIFYKKNSAKKLKSFNGEFIKIGNFQFYVNQNKLVKEAIEINLSKKECELLELFVAHLNAIITHKKLTKTVWEDKGVFVGRSLDTYVSKLRKNLKQIRL